MKSLSIITSALLLAGSAFASGVNPQTVDLTMTVGTSEEVTKEVTTPHGPHNLDLMLMIDLSASYYDDMPVINAMAPVLHDYITGNPEIDSAAFGLASFVDFPLSPWGSLYAGDYVYKLDLDLTFDKTAWVDGVAALSTYSGGDWPQNQYEALYQVATGEGLDVEGDGNYSAPWDVAPGLAPAWRPNTTHVVALTTDYPFHVPGDSDCYDWPLGTTPCPIPYPGHDRDQVVAALNAAGIKVIGIKAGPDVGTELDDLAAATGGAVVTTDTTSEGIGDAIIAALDELTGDVTYEIVGCDPAALDVSLTPALYEDIPGETTVVFEESISVPETAVPGSYSCEVTFKWLDATFENSTQTINVLVEPKVMAVDIKPQSCPNPLNVNKNGVIPVAVLGTDSFDVNELDPTTVTLEGVPALRWSLADVGTPYALPEEPSANSCTEAGADGYMDLTFKFDAQDVIESLASKTDGDTLTLSVNGVSVCGVYYQGQDVVVIINKQ